MTTEAQIRGLGQFARQGFTLEHPDDHLLFLMHDGERIAIFSQTGATEASLQKECAQLAENGMTPPDQYPIWEE